MTIFYRGAKERVEQQLGCDHDWHGPCTDKVSLYYKCKVCHCIQRDCSEEEYYQALKRPMDVYLKPLLKIVTRLIPPPEGKNHAVVFDDIISDDMRFALCFELPDKTVLVPVFTKDLDFSPDEAARRLLFRGQDAAYCIKETAWAIDIGPPPN